MSTYLSLTANRGTLERVRESGLRGRHRNEHRRRPRRDEPRGLMPNENAELTRGPVRRLDAGDLDGIRELLHANVVMWAPRGWLEPGPISGQEAVMRQLIWLGECFPHRRTEIH